MSDLPDPPIPVDLDLTTLDSFMLNVKRLLGSEFAALSTGDEFKAAVLLWCRAWHQVPACSLPDDDRVLASFAGYSRDPKGWAQVREMALRKFVRCSDGRLYHVVLAEDALRAEEARNKNHRRTRAASEARRNRGGGNRHDDRDEDRYDHRDDERSGDRNDAPREERNDDRNEQRNDHQETGQNDKKSDRYVVPGTIHRRNGKKEDPPPSPENVAARGGSEPPQPQPLADWVALIEAFDAVVVEVFGEARRRPNPAGNDGVFAQRWWSLGLRAEQAKAVFRPAQQAAKAKGRRPIGALAWFDNPVQQFLSEPAAVPAGSAPPGPYRGIAERERELWIARLEGYRDSGFWAEEAFRSAPPGHRRCYVPQDLIEQVLGPPPWHIPEPPQINRPRG